jgi:hypothetical protein
MLNQLLAVRISKDRYNLRLALSSAATVFFRVSCSFTIQWRSVVEVRGIRAAILGLGKTTSSLNMTERCQLTDETPADQQPPEVVEALTFD